VEEDYDDIEEPEMGPMPTGRTAPFQASSGGRGVDEVEVSIQVHALLTVYSMPLSLFSTCTGNKGVSLYVYQCCNIG
jgi:hypothetical protein